MTQRVGVGVGCIVSRGSQVLLIRRKNAHGDGTWSTPGGHLEYGESLEDCAKRETREETGVAVDDVEFVSITNDILSSEGKHYLTVWMKARYVSGEPTVASERELSDVGWFAWDDLPRPLFECLANLVEQRGYPKQG